MSYFLRFDGVSDRVVLDSEIPLDDTTFKMTFDVKIRELTSENQYLYARSVNAEIYNYSMRLLPTGMLEATSGSGTKLEQDITSLINTRILIIYEYDGVNLSLSVNGNTVSNNHVPNSNIFRIGFAESNNGGNNIGFAGIDLYSVTIVSGATTYTYDPSASEGTGLTLVDTTSNNNGTLFDFSEGDNHWVVLPSYFLRAPTNTSVQLATNGQLHNDDWDYLKLRFRINNKTGRLTVIGRDDDNSSQLHIDFNTNIINLAAGENAGGTLDATIDEIHELEIIKPVLEEQTDIATTIFDGTVIRDDGELSYNFWWFGHILKTSGTDTHYDIFEFYIESNGIRIHDWDPNVSSGTGLTLTDTAGNQNATLTDYPAGDSHWIAYAIPAEVIITQDPVYGSTIAGTYENFVGTPAESNSVIISDGTRSITVPVTVTDNGGGTGSFTGTVTSLPAAGASLAPGSLVNPGNVTVTFTDPGQ